MIQEGWYVIKEELKQTEGKLLLACCLLFTLKYDLVYCSVLQMLFIGFFFFLSVSDL